MNPRIGKLVLQKMSQESFSAYIPPKLPPVPGIDLKKLYPLLEKATLALANLNSKCHDVPNASLFIYMYVRKEALLSSQIEGTQSSFADLVLFESDQQPEVSIDDIEEVANYVKAINFGLTQIKNDFPLSLRLLKDIHAKLLSGIRGQDKLPGEFRRSQNWIGGTRPGNAIFVPPPVSELNECLYDLEMFLHDTALPVLIKAGIAHVQFESIHPFLDGNGRLGRLLITLLLCVDKVLDEPILYLSLYLKQNRTLYYSLLQEVRTNGSWETWLEFFLEGVQKTASQATDTITLINKLFEQDENKLTTLGRKRISCQKVLNYLKQLPQVTVHILTKQLNLSAPTARSALESMATLKIVEEISGKKRDKTYVYKNYLKILEEGAEPFSR